MIERHRFAQMARELGISVIGLKVVVDGGKLHGS